ncbi:MAG: hypothetical protein NC416_01120 [Eubacterium sp.]|nr:hypothetical protein [Eubacterium sp.]
MSLLEELKDLGVNIEEGLERVMDDEPLYETMLGMYIDKVDSNPIALEDFEGDDLETLISRVHILKGLTGNLAMTPLFEGYVQALDLLRSGNPADAKKEYERILPAQAAIIDCIKRNINDE